MKKIYTQKNLLIFLLIPAIIFVFAGVLGGIYVNPEYWFLLIVSCLFLSLVPLIFYNKIYYNEEKIKFHFLIRKLELKLSDIKQIYLKKDLVLGYSVIFNFSETANKTFDSFYDYAEFCNQNNYDTLYVTGVAKKDIAGLLKNYKGSILI